MFDFAGPSWVLEVMNCSNYAAVYSGFSQSPHYQESCSICYESQSLMGSIGYKNTSAYCWLSLRYTSCYSGVTAIFIQAHILDLLSIVDMLRESVLMGASSFSFPGVNRERTSIDAQTQDSVNKCFLNLQPSNQQFVMSHATECVCVCGHCLCARGEICPDRTQVCVCV